MAELVEHLSAHAIDRYLADLASPDQAGELESHANSCSACATRLDQARTARERFLAANPPQLRAEELIAATRKGGRRTFGVGVAAACAAAAAGIALFALYPHDRSSVERPTDTHGDIRSKGAAEVVFQILDRGEDELRPAVDGEVLSAGDTIQIHVTTTELVHATIVAMSHDGEVTTVLSFQTDRAGPAPRALVVDDSPHSERLFVVLSPSVIETALVDAAASAAFAAAGGLAATQSFAVAGEPDAIVRSLLIARQNSGRIPSGPDVPTRDTNPSRKRER